MGQSITQQIKPYESIFSAEYGDYIAKEIESSARWTGTSLVLLIRVGIEVLLGTILVRHKHCDYDDEVIYMIPQQVLKDEYELLLDLRINKYLHRDDITH